LEVPIAASQDPTFLRNLLLSSGAGIVRIGVFGDSQEASPDFWGRHYIMECNALLVEALGPTSETVLLGQRWLDSTPEWLAATANVSSSTGPVPQIPSAAVPPGVLARARIGPADGSDAFHAVLMPGAERCVVPHRVSGSWFHDGSEVVVDVLLARRSMTGSLAWRGSIIETSHPTPDAPPLIQGILPGQPADGAQVGWVTTGALPRTAHGFRQVSILGAHPDAPVDVLGARFRNSTQSRGVLLQPLAVGGASIGDLVAKHGASGPAIAALGLDAAMLHFGANDGYLSAQEWATRLQKAIDVLRWMHGDPHFPIIIVSDTHQRELPAGSQYDFFPGAAAAVAQTNPSILAFNMRRIHEERFLWNDSQNLGLADSVHHKPHAQYMMARALVSTMLETAGLPVPGCEPNESWADHYHPLGASCAPGMPCALMVEADADSVGRPFVAGGDCSDDDGDGSIDDCQQAPSPDLTRDGVVDGADLGLLMTLWASDDSTADITGDGLVNGADLGRLLIFWGPLP
jgi:hypothetical protein